MSEHRAPLSADYDAFRQPREVRPGCNHTLGCRCTPPFWLREPTAAEQRRYWQPPNAPRPSTAGRTVERLGDELE